MLGEMVALRNLITTMDELYGYHFLLVNRYIQLAMPSGAPERHERSKSASGNGMHAGCKPI